MKKIFWTSMVWILIFICFGVYLRFFNNKLGENIADYLLVSSDYKTGKNIDYAQEILQINEHLQEINIKVENILKNLNINNEEKIFDENSVGDSSLSNILNNPFTQK